MSVLHRMRWVYLTRLSWRGKRTGRLRRCCVARGCGCRRGGLLHDLDAPLDNLKLHLERIHLTDLGCHAGKVVGEYFEGCIVESASWAGLHRWCRCNWTSLDLSSQSGDHGFYVVHLIGEVIYGVGEIFEVPALGLESSGIILDLRLQP